MRASRLVSFLLVLQTRGQLTAEELAERLEVSERTVQRDAQALAAAGVPIVSVRGPAGGYRLERGYRTKLTGLDATEAEALFVGPAAELGLGRELAAARLKLLASLPDELQDRAGRAAQLFHVDMRGWFREEDRVPHLPAIAGALWRGRRLDIRYREGAAVVARRLDPLGLVLKAGVWYLLARRRGRGARLPRLAHRLREGARGPRRRARRTSISRPPGRAARRRSSASRPQVEVTVRVPRSQVRYLRGARVVADDEPADRRGAVRGARPRLSRAHGLGARRRGDRAHRAAPAHRRRGRETAALYAGSSAL